MKVFVTGGTGFVGKALTSGLVGEGHQVTVLTRSLRPGRSGPSGVRLVEGDATKPGSWQEEVPEHDAVINLVGASIFRRWTEAAKEEIRESRIRTTRNLVRALPRGGSGFRFLSTSAVGVYGSRGDEVLNEESPAGAGFLASLAVDWERAAMEAEARGAAVSCMRFGIVLGREEGALAKMLPLFRWWLGGPLGGGGQWFSWIHIHDLVAAHLFALGRRDLRGPLNCTAPHPVRNKDLARALAGAMGKPCFMPGVPRFLVRMVLGEFGSVLLEGQRVIPERLREAGFHFTFPRIEEALNDLVGAGSK